MSSARADYVTTAGRAETVRRLRVNDGLTWRGIAEACALAWSGDWGSNQLVGMQICHEAAEWFGESSMSAPWN